LWEKNKTLNEITPYKQSQYVFTAMVTTDIASKTSVDLSFALASCLAGIKESIADIRADLKLSIQGRTVGILVGKRARVGWKKKHVRTCWS
jgi:hypothetical protein